jgi:predicted GNAT family N-acyltransferase
MPIYLTEHSDSPIYRDALMIRRRVFVDEQRVPFDHELDQEERCWHMVYYWSASDPNWRFQPTHARDADFAARDDVIGESAGAELSLQPAGTIRIFPLNTLRVKLQRLAVLPEFRGRGIAHQLFDFAEALVRRRGFNQIEFDGQSYLKEFYLAKGYAVLGDEFLEENIAHLLFFKSW